MLFDVGVFMFTKYRNSDCDHEVTGQASEDDGVSMVFIYRSSKDRRILQAQKLAFGMSRMWKAYLPWWVAFVTPVMTAVSHLAL